MATVKLSIKSGKAAGTSSNMPLVIIPSTITNLGTLTTAEAESCRIYSDSSLTTELAREVVSADEIHVKVPSLSSSTEIWFDYDGVRADYGVGTTYGRNAVWSDYTIVHHFNEYEANPTNSIGSNNGTAFSLSTSDEVTGAVGGGLDMPNNDDYVSTANASMTAYSLQAIVKKNGTSGIVQDTIIERATSTGTFTRLQILRVNSTGTVNFQGRNGTSGENFDVNSASTITNNAWRWVSGTITSGAQAIYIDGSSNATGSVTHGANTLATNFYINRTYDSSARYLKASFDEVRVRPSALSADWITTEYNNQSDNAAFWEATPVGGGGAPTGAGFWNFF
jgi:hypothetical protein